MPAIVFKSVKPSKLKIDSFRVEALTALNKVANGMKKDFEKTTATWNHTVTFEIVKDFRRSGNYTPAVLVGTDDKIYKFLDEGTAVRRAVMTPDFSAKTSVRVLGSKPGSGGVAYIGKRVSRPGIEARHFSDEVQKKWQSRFKQEIEDAMNNAAKKSGHSI